MLKDKRVFVLQERLNCDNAGSKSLGVSQLDDIGLYTTAEEKLRTVSRAASIFVKRPSMLAFSTLVDSTQVRKMFLRKVKLSITEQTL